VGAPTYPCGFGLALAFHSSLARGRPSTPTVRQCQEFQGEAAPLPPASLHIALPWPEFARLFFARVRGTPPPRLAARTFLRGPCRRAASRSCREGACQHAQTKNGPYQRAVAGPVLGTTQHLLAPSQHAVPTCPDENRPHRRAVAGPVLGTTQHLLAPSQYAKCAALYKPRYLTAASASHLGVQPPRWWARSARASFT